MALRRYIRTDQRAAAALEFALVAPAFVMFLFAVLGSGLDGFYQLTLDEAVRNAARQVQLDASASTGGASFIAAVCNEFAALAPDCTSKLSYSLQAGSTTAGFSSLTPLTLSASGQLPGSFFAGSSYAANDNILVQVAYPLPFTLPFVSTWITGTGTGSILATATVRAEPL